MFCTGSSSSRSAGQAVTTGGQVQKKNLALLSSIRPFHSRPPMTTLHNDQPHLTFQSASTMSSSPTPSRTCLSGRRLLAGSQHGRPVAPSGSRRWLAKRCKLAPQVSM